MGALQPDAARVRRATFELVQTVCSDATLQVTFNLREVGRACKVLSEYAVYLWNCDHEGEYELRGLAKGSAVSADALKTSRSALRQYRRLAPTCYGGRHPNMDLEIHEAEATTSVPARAAIMARMLLPPGLCAVIYQSAAASRPNNCDGRLISISTNEMA